ncbi:MAG: OmpA family protein [Candidatus Eiseniibacteriota bacterium]
MNHRFPFVLPLAAAFVLLAAGSANAGPFDKIKKTADDTTKKAGETVDKTKQDAEKGQGAGEKPAASGSGDAGSAGKSAGGGSSGSNEKVSAVSTKFDFVPGDSVIFMDDFTQDDLGEFPARWRLAQGTFETAEMEGERWLRSVSQDGRIRMKMPATTSLPEFWTLEFDFWAEEPMSQAVTVRGLGKDENYAWEVMFPGSNDMVFRSDAIYSSAPYEGTVPGRHHIMIMARGTAIKAYIDRQRLVNVPEYSDKYGVPLQFEFRFFCTTKPMMTNVRFAEGCRPAKDMLAEGKLVTYGIHFETGSDVVQPDSAPILRQIAAYLESKPDVKLNITGHTDNVGKAADNLDLSKRRAASVAKVLSTQFGIAADRFQADGKGDTQPLSSNAKPEGRAMNRRVEFAKVTGSSGASR